MKLTKIQWYISVDQTDWKSVKWRILENYGQIRLCYICIFFHYRWQTINAEFTTIFFYFLRFSSLLSSIWILEYWNFLFCLNNLNLVFLKCISFFRSNILSFRSIAFLHGRPFDFSWYFTSSSNIPLCQDLEKIKS